MVTQAKTKKAVARKRTAAKPVKKVQERTHAIIPDNYIRDLGELAKVLKEKPAIIDSIRVVLDYHVVDPIDRRTFPRIVNAMSMLLGPNVAMAITLVCHLNTPAFFDDLQDATKNKPHLQEAVDIIKFLSSIYGDRLQRAYTLSSGTVDEDWSSLDLNTYKREGDEPLWLIDMKVSLYNGEDARIKMIPNSAFQFLGILMKELVEKVPSDQVDPELVDNYREVLFEFAEIYHMDEIKEKNNHPEGYA